MNPSKISCYTALLQTKAIAATTSSTYMYTFLVVQCLLTITISDILKVNTQQQKHHCTCTYNNIYLVNLLHVGEIGEASGTQIAAVTHWNYKTISRGPDSLIGKLIARHNSNERSGQLHIISLVLPIWRTSLIPRLPNFFQRLCALK